MSSPTDTIEDEPLNSDNTAFFIDFPFVPMASIMLTHCIYPTIILGRYNSVIPIGIIRVLEDFPVTIHLPMVSIIQGTMRG